MNQLLNISESEYRALDAANYSTLKHAAQSAAHMRAAMLEKREPSPAMVLGSYVDSLVFAGETATADRFAVAPVVDRRTTVGKETWAAFVANAANKTVIDADSAERGRAMFDAVRGHNTATALLSGNQYQRALTWKDEATGVQCKALVDSVLPGVTLTDLKTTANASWREFSRSVASFAYYLQAAFYCDGWRAVTGETLPYTFIAVESAAPYGVAVYRLDDAAIEAGRARYRAALTMYRDCMKSGVWPAYSDDLTTLELPRWALSIGVPGFVPDIPDPF